MGKKKIVKPRFLCGNDWEDFSRRFPDAYHYMWLCAVHNELQTIELGEERRQEILWQLADQATAKVSWDHRFL